MQDKSVQSLPLIGITWSLETFAGEATVPYDPVRTPVSLRFDEEGAVAGRSGCNRFRSSYTLAEEGRLQIGAVAMTRMVCPPPAMEVEAAFARALQSAFACRIEGSRLIIDHAAGALIFVA